MAAGVRRIVVTSSGAAYGYHADNPAWLTEEHPLRGNEEFAYSHHKRLVEEMLAEFRAPHPALEQVVFRVGTILGDHTRQPDHGAVRTEAADRDPGRGESLRLHLGPGRGGVPGAGHRGWSRRVYNVAGDGTMTIEEIAAAMGKRCLTCLPGLLQAAARHR